MTFYIVSEQVNILSMLKIVSYAPSVTVRVRGNIFFWDMIVFFKVKHDIEDKIFIRPLFLELGRKHSYTIEKKEGIFLSPKKSVCALPG